MNIQFLIIDKENAPDTKGGTENTSFSSWEMLLGACLGLICGLLIFESSLVSAMLMSAAAGGTAKFILYKLKPNKE